MTDGPIAVTGASGRLGRALLATGGRTLAWGRPDIDLDDARCWAPLLERDGPAIVIHAAAMTDVDACARDPELAMRRNGDATDALASACHERGVGLVVISTNEVFDGERRDGRGYVETDAVGPRNPYGASKLSGEQRAQAVFDDRPGLWVVRTAWLYGPPGNDFPDKIVAAADRLPVDERLPVVHDEVGSPTLTWDLAAALLVLLERTEGGTFHLANAGAASRQQWADRVLAARRAGRTTRPISAAEFVRASRPPRWGVLSSERTAAAGIHMRDWQVALDAYLAA